MQRLSYKNMVRKNPNTTVEASNEFCRIYNPPFKTANFREAVLGACEKLPTEKRQIFIDSFGNDLPPKFKAGLKKIKFDDNVEDIIKVDKEEIDKIEVEIKEEVENNMELIKEVRQLRDELKQLNSDSNMSKLRKQLKTVTNDVEVIKRISDNVYTVMPEEKIVEEVKDNRTMFQKAMELEKQFK